MSKENTEKVNIKADEIITMLNGIVTTVAKENSEIKKENLVLFISFDLVNSTKFKSYNYSNWFNVIYIIIEQIRKRILLIDENFQLWRTIGDEVVFTIKILDIDTLKYIIQELYILMCKIKDELKDGSIFKKHASELLTERELDELSEQNILSIKSTAWIAHVCNDKQSKKKMYNVQYDYATVNGVITEFQGNDIDTGFRVAKECTNPRRFALSLELAYLLSKDKSVKSKLNLIGYTNLKGIWDNRLYPIIWYHDDYVSKCKIEESFFYDEHESEDLVKSFLAKKDINDNVDINQLLEKIIDDQNLNIKIGKIEELVQSDDNNNKSAKAINVNSSAGELIEVHCVAVCVKNNKVFMAKRSNKKNDFAGLWEFGCAKMKIDMSFRQVLEEEYKKHFNLDIIIDKPFKDYTFKKNQISVSGIRYKAHIIGETNIKLSDEYDKWGFFSLSEFEEIKEEVIDYEDFKSIIEEVLD